MQNLINNALAFQSRSYIPKNPPPPYNNSKAECLFKPRMDMYESSSSSSSRPLITATFELPGLRKEDVHIDIIEGNMIVTGDRNRLTAIEHDNDDEMKDDGAERAEEGEILPGNQSGYTVREIKRGRFRRVVPLPAGIHLEDVKASMSDGILTVTFPGKPKPVPQSIPVV